MKKSAVMICLGLLLVCLFFYGCGGSRTSEAKAIMEKQVSLMENFITAMDNAGDAKTVAAAFTDFGVGMKELTPKMLELSKKYPGLYKESPEDLKPLVKKIEELSPKMGAAMMKAMQYGNDPAVQEALKNFTSTMAQQPK
ncbi:MAG: hypothetical protein EHM45_07780 [Desulfobacteraceae bacterium]|nr:MAG: hypothetical protein EHM45_07780 [Desulfobacteraceae bacterium]